MSFVCIFLLICDSSLILYLEKQELSKMIGPNLLLNSTINLSLGQGEPFAWPKIMRIFYVFWTGLGFFSQCESILQLCMMGIKRCVACGYTIIPTALLEKTLPSSSHFLHSVKSQCNQEFVLYILNFPAWDLFQNYWWICWYCRYCTIWICRYWTQWINVVEVAVFNTKFW